MADLFACPRGTVDAILISHYHRDDSGHIEDVPEGVPIFMGEKAAHIFNTTNRFTNRRIYINAGNYLVNGEKVVIGDFKITPYLVDHSAYDAYAFVISAEGKKVIYTGDLGHTAIKRRVFVNKLPARVNALIVEGTMMSRLTEPVKSEGQIGRDAEKFMSIPNRPIFVLQSSTNIDRLVQMYKAAKHTKRIFVMDVYTANVVSKLGNNIPNPHTFILNQPPDKLLVIFGNGGCSFRNALISAIRFRNSSRPALST